MIKQIFVVKPGTISKEDKATIKEAGCIVIEHEQPETVKIQNVPEHLPFVYTNCYTCGDRIYLTEERMKALKQNKKSFCCSHGHYQSYS